MAENSRALNALMVWLCRAVLICGVLPLAIVEPASALPSFAVQTGQPCAACHVGAFGPQLTQVGRDFKLFGYVATDTKSHWPPLNVIAQSSFTHTQANQATSPAPHFATNDNFALDSLQLLYGGRVAGGVGAYVETTYSGIDHSFSWDAVDIRRAFETELFGQDAVLGVTLNNGPTVSDVWNSTSQWGFPYAASSLAPTPNASALIDNNLHRRVFGAGGYASWNSLLYLEFDAYAPLAPATLKSIGVLDPTANQTKGLIPYWRVAAEHMFEGDRHYIQLGSFGQSASVYPAGSTSQGTDQITDIGFDATYQWRLDPNDVTADTLSAHATAIFETLDQPASHLVNGTNASNRLTTLRADVSYAIGATITPSLQYFTTFGSRDAAQWGTANGSPNSAGWRAEIAYVPLGRPDSFIRWGNARLALQYVGYTKFNGTTARAGDNNTLYLSLTLALGGYR